MSRSSIDQLPADILEQLQALLRDPRVQQLDIVAQINTLLDERGETLRISKSALNRYALRFEDVGKRLQQSREIADMWIGKLGSQPQGQVGHLINEMLRTLAFDVSMDMAKLATGDPEALPAVVKMLNTLALAVSRLEKASTDNFKREREIRREALEQAAEQADRIAKSQGLSADTVAALKKEILGIA